MTQSSYAIRIFGGRNLVAVYDDAAGTVTVAGQSLTLSTLSAALQTQFATAVASGTGANALGARGSAAFGGSNTSAAIGALMDGTPTWRAAVAAAVANLKDDTATMQAGT
jgi:hypothetical protein